MLAAMHLLRAYASVPQNIASFIHDGDCATIAVEQYPERTFTSRVTRHSRALDTATRMVLIDVDLPNSEDTLPGNVRHDDSCG